ncbi:serine acetyltransferase [Novymonas esmeraldas]|uniref:serine O-acetyltransferase n=1 Tax=Novymonas esmeraldas TaxID=1808958 RepID=A0AAW0EUR8_9TRYP
MRRLDRIRAALEQLTPYRQEESLPTLHPHISHTTLKELIECLFFVFFPECTNPPTRVAPTDVEADSLMEWVVGHIADILTTQISFAFILHGDAQAVANTTVFRPFTTAQRTELEWDGGRRSAAMPLFAEEQPSTGNNSTATKAAEEKRRAAAPLHAAPRNGDYVLLLPTAAASPSIAGDAAPRHGVSAPREPLHLHQTDSGVFLANCRRKANAVVTKFLVERLAHVRWLLHTDLEAIFKGDVAASSPSEVVLCYPGLRCMVHQRVAHQLHLLGVPQNFTRMLTEIAHSMTGIDIHPNTPIGHHFFIDHGTGIVVGATAIIGNGVSIYQGVTLGARSFPTDKKTGEKIRDLPRHPIIEDGVTLYANAVVLGRVTIGERSTIGGNCWVVRDVPPFSSIVQKSNHVLQPHESMFLEKDGSGI